MKNVIVMMSFLLALVCSCSPKGTPSGHAEEDARAFAKEIFAAYDADNVVEMKKTIDVYYEFYKNQPETDIKVFFNVWKEELETKIDAGKIDPTKMGTMAQEADKYGKLDELYKRVR